jgi:putative ATPase
MERLGYGEGYVYAHDTGEGTAGLMCLPDRLGAPDYYRPVGRGREKELKERARAIRELRTRLARERETKPRGA